MTRRKLSIDEYHRMGEAGIIAPDERVELIHGEIIEMSPIGNEHLGIVGRINAVLTPLLIGRYIVFSQSPVKIANHSEPEPDLMVVPHRDDYYTTTGVKEEDVLLIIEVADTTLKKDLTVKLPLYARAEIPEVWIMDVNKKVLHQFVEPHHDKYLKHHILYREKEVSASQLDLQVKIKDLIG